MIYKIKILSHRLYFGPIDDSFSSKLGKANRYKYLKKDKRKDKNEAEN